MPDQFFIIKGTKVELWNDERAVGTLVVSGVAPDVALKTVSQARALFREFGARSIDSKQWVLLSEELRRGNLGAAATMVMNLPKEVAAPIETPIEGNSEWSPERLRELTAETLERMRKTDSFGHLQDNEAYYVATLSAADPMLGLITARRNEILDILTLRAGREVIPEILRAFEAVLEDLPGGVKPDAFADLKRRLYALTSDPASANVKALYRQFVVLSGKAQAMGLLQASALNAAVPGLASIFCPFPGWNWAKIVEFAPELAPYRLTEDEVGQTRTRPRLGATFQTPGENFSVPRPVPVADDPRDQLPPPVYGEEIDPSMVYARWTTVEWPPFIRPDKHSFWCNTPIRDGDGDRTKLHELPGERSLRAKPKVHQLRHVTEQWIPRIAQYWPIDIDQKKMQPVPAKEHTWVDVFIIETKDTEELDDFLKKLRDRLTEELDKESTKEKIEKAIRDGIDSIAGGVTFFGFDIAQLAANGSKLAASALLTLIAWLMDQVFAEEAFQEIIVTHKTSGSTKALQSWVTWSTRDRDSGLATPFDPRENVPPPPPPPPTNPNAPPPPPPISVVPPVPPLATRPLGSSTGAMVAYGLDLPGITWTAESKVPDFLPTDVNKLFLLPNAAHGAIYWPPSWSYGGHVFLPVRARHSDAVYCLAVRTEVRAVLLSPT